MRMERVDVQSAVPQVKVTVMVRVKVKVKGYLGT